MKKILVIVFAVFSFSAISQSYLVLESGLTLTTDREGFVYDFGHYTPVNRVTVKGGQYLIEDNNVLVTVDERGLLFRKYEVLPSQIKGKGMNYFIGVNGSLYIIDTMGVASIIEGDAKMATASKFGGNYFIAGVDELYTVSVNGGYTSAFIEGLKVSDIVTFGGNYFMTNRGHLYTVSSEGKVARTVERVGIIVKKGGNYFVDSMGMIYTVAEDGSLKIPGIPMNLRINALSKLGADYFIDSTGKLFTVDRHGNIWERTVLHDLKTTKIISL